MASIITATTTSGLTQSADNSGVLQLASGTGNLVTIPSVTGTAMVSGNMPAFSAYGTVDVSVPTATFTKITYSTEEYDTNNNFASSRFTPTVAGYYMVHAFFEYNGYASNGLWSLYIWKNGSSWRRFQTGPAVSGNWKAEGTDIMYLNGSTDYIEIYAYQGVGSTQTIYNSNGQLYNVFQAALVRAA